ncbi:MAG: molybdenum cofactor guanylyltransferase, partial [Candidatus Omnitrophota bacterium]|nr:molybdenum cofactor guanylyltransferase [Candidatus Omnitrophota bacterium]
LKIGNQPLIKRQIELLKKIFKKIIIVTNSLPKYRGYKGIKIISDLIPHRGPLGGIYSGLMASSSFYNFTLACDMPFINQALIRYIIRNRDNYDIVIPKIDKKYHPLFGVYSKNCIPVIEKALRKDKLNVSTIFPKVKTGFISRQEIERFDKLLLSLVNINTRDDLAMLKAMKGAKICQRQYFQR